MEERVPASKPNLPSPAFLKGSKKHTMCRAKGYQSRTCGHRWLTIIWRCGPDIGFTTRPNHGFETRSTLLGETIFHVAPANSCPNCDLRGQYDGNTTRMVLRTGIRECMRSSQNGTWPYTTQTGVNVQNNYQVHGFNQNLQPEYISAYYGSHGLIGPSSRRCRQRPEELCCVIL